MIRSRFPGLGPVLAIAAIAVSLALIAGCGLLDDNPAGDTIVNVDVDQTVNGTPTPTPTPRPAGSACTTSDQCDLGLVCLTIEGVARCAVAPTPTPTPTTR